MDIMFYLYHKLLIMKNDIIKNIKTQVVQVVDPTTGEIMDESIKKVQVVVNPDEFALIYAGLWDVILGKPLSKSDIELLAYLIKRYSDGTMFTVNTPLKNDVARETGKSTTSYNNSTRKLLDHNLIIRLPNSKRTYVLNPRYAFKGSSTNRKKALIEILDWCPDC